MAELYRLGVDTSSTEGMELWEIAIRAKLERKIYPRAKMVVQDICGWPCEKTLEDAQNALVLEFMRNGVEDMTDKIMRITMRTFSPQYYRNYERVFGKEFDIYAED